MAAMRAMVEPNKGRMQGTAARAPFDEIMNRVKEPSGVTFHEDTVGRAAQPPIRTSRKHRRPDWLRLTWVALPRPTR